MGQVGSRHDSVEYDITNHVFYVNIDFAPIDKVRFFADLTYVYSEGDVESPSFGSDLFPVYYQGAPVATPPPPPYSYPAAYFDSDFSNSDDWSDLEYERVDATIGTEVNVWKNLSFKVNFTYRWFDDKEEYLGEDLDGEVYILNTAVIWKF